jgi:hypothetical protein
MNYADFSNPASLYKINPDGQNYLSPTDDGKTPKTKAQLVSAIIEFSRLVGLWHTLDGPEWGKPGLNNLKIDDNVIKSGLLNGNPCTIKFSYLHESARAELRYDNFAPEFILLNANIKYQHYTIPTWSQVLFMELGNYRNYDNFQEIYKDKSLSSEKFVEKWEELEFDIRSQIVDAYDQGQFDSTKYVKPECIFKHNVNFKAYMADKENEWHINNVKKLWWNRK